MKNVLILFLAFLSGSILGTSWIFLGFSMLPWSYQEKLLLIAMLPIIGLGLIKYFHKTSTFTDIAWVVIFLISAFLAFFLSGAALGLMHS